MVSDCGVSVVVIQMAVNLKSAAMIPLCPHIARKIPAETFSGVITATAGFERSQSLCGRRT
jgi:hypothetical protein